MRPQKQYSTADYIINPHHTLTGFLKMLVA